MTDSVPGTRSVAELLESRKRLVRQRMRELGLRPAAVTGATGGPRPLTAPQRRMWLAQQLDPSDTTLNISTAFRLTGELSASRLRTACGAIAARHDVLHSRYQMGRAGIPEQVPAADTELDWQEQDLTALSGDAQRRRLEVLARREFARPFDLEKCPPWRMLLVRLSATQHVLVLAAHHICWDEQSWPVFARELSAAYNDGGPLPELPPIQQTAGGAAGSDDFWRETLTPPPPAIELPGEQAGSPATTTAARQCTVLPADLLAGAAQLAARHGATQFMVLLAGFCGVINAMTGTTDLVVAVPVSLRSANSEGRIGYYGNMVPVRVRIHPRMTFSQLLTVVANSCSAAFAHQDTGIDEIIALADPERARGTGVAALARISFAARSTVAGFALDGIEATEIDLGGHVSAEPLSLMVVAGAGPARAEATYQSAIVAAPVAAQLLESYSRLLAAAIARPELRVDRLDLLGDTARTSLLAASSGTQSKGTATTLLAMFEQQAAAGSERIALASDEVSLTYGQLDSRANQLARWLIAAGIGPERTVALRSGTSVEFIVMVLAVLKAGGAYLPIDRAHPPARVRYLLSDAAPGLVLDEAAIAAAVAESGSQLDTGITDSHRRAPLRPDNLAYLMYTSGSTGEPKGVAVAHAAIADHVAGFCAESGMTSADVVLQSASVSFDASLLDIFVTLSLGAKLVVPKPNLLQDMAYLADTITRQSVTVLHFVPSVLSSLLLLPASAQWRQLRHVPVGGEALPGELADKFASMFDAQLRNHYGPTEAVVCATAHPVRGPQGRQVVPIGRPNRNVQCYVLDTSLRLVPAGVTGEIYVGGGQLAREYLNQPGLTASRFIADPYRPGGRLYRTGDLARRNTAGDLEFRGRADEQVKIRGLRIELGEVEAAVQSYPGVAHCVAAVRPDTGAGQTLAAYVVASTPPDAGLLRAHLAELLPEYMIPTGFAVIDTIPQTVHGKLDRAALPVPGSLAGDTYRVPATPTEERVAAIYARLFTRERVGADESFFALGGHSLLAARLVTMIDAEFGAGLTVRDIFDNPTVAGLAREIVAVLRAELGIDLDQLAVEAAPTAAVRPGRIPLSHSQLAIWFQQRMEGPSAALNLLLQLRITGPLDYTALGTALCDVVARHEALRAGFAEHDGMAYQFVAQPGQVALPVVQTTRNGLTGELAALRAQGFKLDDAGLVRARLFALGPQSQLLAVVIHHLVADHATLATLAAELADAYQHRLGGQLPQWPAVAPQYAEYVVWQQEFLDSPIGQRQLSYWRDQLRGLPAEVGIARDRPRPPVPPRASETVTVRVSPAERKLLLERAAAAGATEFMLCQIAVAAAMYLLGAGRDIPLGTPVAARTQQVTHGLAGLTANMVVLRNRLAADSSLTGLLRESRDTVLAAFEHQEMPIQRIVDTLGPPRSPARNPLFQAMVQLRDSMAPMPFGEASACMEPVEFATALLDLTVDFAATSDGGAGVRIVAAGELYDAATVELAAETLHLVLTAFAATPDVRLGQLRRVTADRAATIDQWGTGAQQSAPAGSRAGSCPVRIGGLVAATDSLAMAHQLPAAATLVAVPPDSPEAVSCQHLRQDPNPLLVSDGRRDNPDAIAELILADRPNRVAAPGAVLSGLSLAGAQALPSVTVWSVLEPAGPAALASRLAALAPGSRTEFHYRKDEYLGSAVIDGRPVPGAYVVVLDEQLRVVPPGVTGQVYLSGAALALGYHGAAGRTATRFVAHPVRAGQRMFSTGDFARWNHQGTLIFTAPAPEPAPASAESVPPRSEVLEPLIAILQELLETTAITGADNYFALGGDSIMAVQWSARASAAGIALTVPAIFEQPTIAAIAAAAEIQQAASPAASQSQPMSASGLDDAALTALTAAWSNRA